MVVGLKVASLGEGAVSFYPAPCLRSLLVSIHYGKSRVHSVRFQLNIGLPSPLAFTLQS